MEDLGSKRKVQATDLTIRTRIAAIKIERGCDCQQNSVYCIQNPNTLYSPESAKDKLVLIDAGRSCQLAPATSAKSEKADIPDSIGGDFQQIGGKN
jgi:hypothetical protein